MASIRLNVNGTSHAVDVDETTPLLYVLADDLGLRGPKFGCGLGQCGCCTVIAGGQPVRSCVTPVGRMDGATITTLEGLGSIARPHPIQQAFIDEQAMQCGFCLSGVILTAKIALDRNPRASDDDLRRALATVLCRCGAHTRMFKAIERYRTGLDKRAAVASPETQTARNSSERESPRSSARSGSAALVGTLSERKSLRSSAKSGSEARVGAVSRAQKSTLEREVR